MGRLDRIGNEGLNVNYYSSIDYSGAAGEAIFINSNLILTEPAVSASGEGLYWGEAGPEETKPRTQATYVNTEERTKQPDHSKE